MEIARNLWNRNINPFIMESKEEAKEKVMSLIEEEQTVSWGGSKTLKQCGIIEALKNREDINVLDKEEDPEAMKKSFNADVYLTGANAILKDGRIVNIDGRGNRVAATVYGPKRIIIVAGMNKIVDGSLDDAIARVKNEAAPENAKRLGKDTPCAETGECEDCSSSDRICRSIGIIEWRKTNDMDVVLVRDELGF